MSGAAGAGARAAAETVGASAGDRSVGGLGLGNPGEEGVAGRRLGDCSRRIPKGQEV